jgi:RNA polymerase subunit RPABC4/transcription elongation factor Spt4
LKDEDTIAMRNCPHCGKEIQDEASFCRFCRRDVDPPLWLTSLQKCPYCAEWVERGIERCPLCGKGLATEEPFYISEEADSTERLLNEVRENIFAKDKFEEDDEQRDEEEIPETPPFQVVPRTREKKQAVSEDPYESQEGLGVLRERQRSHIPLEPIEELDSREIGKKPKRPRIRIPLAKIIPWLLLMVATVVVIGLAIYAFQEFDPLGSLGLGASTSPTDDILPVPTETALEPTTPTPTIGAAVLPPELNVTATPGACMLWSEITSSMEGQTVCAYGVIKRRFRVDNEIPYMAIFSEEEGTFAIVDRTTFYTQFRPGDCIQTQGEVELMRGVRPFIDANNALIACPTGE